MSGCAASSACAGIGGAHRRLHGQVERYTRYAPYNWFNFYDFWNISEADDASYLVWMLILLCSVVPSLVTAANEPTMSPDTSGGAGALRVGEYPVFGVAQLGIVEDSVTGAWLATVG